MRRIAFLPREAVHAIGCFLHLSPEADRSDDELAKVLERTSPRDLLWSVAPATPRLYKSLRRAPGAVAERSFYERLCKLSTGPLADMILSGESLTSYRLDLAEAILAMDPVIVTLRPLFDRSPNEIESVNSLIRFLRAHGQFTVHEFRLPERAGLKSLVARLQRALDRVSAPSPGFSLSPPFRVISTIGEMRRAGKLLGNCLADMRYHGAHYWTELATGTTIYVVREDGEPVVASLSHLGPCLLYIQEICGPKNERAPADARTELTAALRGAGCHVLGQHPTSATNVVNRFLGNWRGEDIHQDGEDALGEVCDDPAEEVG